MIIFIIILSLLLENIMSNLIPMGTFFNPLFSIVALVIIYPYFNNDDLRFIKFCAVIGLIYDIIFTNTLFLNMIVFIVVGLTIKLINIILSNNFINVMVISFISIVIYLILTYLILVIIGYKTFDFNYLFSTISKSLLSNIIYSFVIYIITDKISKKHKILKID
ncbi:MAG: rod shape-determining protein MreD [Bacilli bacterium]|nr:rod shape-determining protein MreD [Bacilli bacterium]MDD4282393.1 rod shape-determining protein MreD [Bacilli bacterium]MDD4718982.1 rod shape-determining protein MreD [Bacilli bacterium]